LNGPERKGLGRYLFKHERQNDFVCVLYLK
jgi:hypothetical protein